MLMKEVDSFLGVRFFFVFFFLSMGLCFFLCVFFFFIIFFAKDGVPQSVFVQECFVYMYLQTNIHKKNICRVRLS